MFWPKFYPRLSILLHRYICHICDIMKLCFWCRKISDENSFLHFLTWDPGLPSDCQYIQLYIMIQCSKHTITTSEDKIIIIIMMIFRRHSVPMICHSSLAVPSSSTLAPSSYSLNIITGGISSTSIINFIQIDGEKEEKILW